MFGNKKEQKTKKDTLNAKVDPGNMVFVWWVLCLDSATLNIFECWLRNLNKQIPAKKVLTPLCFVKHIPYILSKFKIKRKHVFSYQATDSLTKKTYQYKQCKKHRKKWKKPSIPQLRLATHIFSQSLKTKRFEVWGLRFEVWGCEGWCFRQLINHLTWCLVLVY